MGKKTFQFKNKTLIQPFHCELLWCFAIPLTSIIHWKSDSLVYGKTGPSFFLFVCVSLHLLYIAETECSQPLKMQFYHTSASLYYKSHRFSTSADRTSTFFPPHGCHQVQENLRATYGSILLVNGFFPWGIIWA